MSSVLRNPRIRAVLVLFAIAGPLLFATGITPAGAEDPGGTLSPVGHWALDDAAGSTGAADSSGSGNHGLCGGSFDIGSGQSRTLDCPTFGDAGPVGTAADFGDISSYAGLRVMNTIPNSFTVIASFKTTDTTGWAGSHAFSGRGIIWSDRSGFAPDSIAMSLTGGHLAFGTNGTDQGTYTYNTLTSVEPVSTGEWVCAAVTRDTTTGAKQLYINGRLDVSNTEGGTGTLDANPYIVFGANPLDYRYFDGGIDDIYFYDRVLSETEIRGHCPAINEAPTANAGGPYLVAVDGDIVLDGAGSSDPDGDAMTEGWTVAGGTVEENTYTAGTEPGIYDVCLTVNDGTVDSAESCTIVVVYDPSAGFVTGGGWIDSPAGAYVDDPGLTGRANFGFVAKYKKGANVPDGNTQFQFNTGDLNFHSTSYDWLVIAGQDKAKYKGTGTINGTGNYGFMLTAVDNGNAGDTFRIKIWDKDNGDTVVYDNSGDADDSSYDGTAISGGNIKVQSK